MDYTQRTILASLTGAMLAIWIGFGVASESYVSGAAVVTIAGWVLLAWRGGPWPEVTGLAVALFGYIVGNRGFAQFSLTDRMPLLPAEAAMIACLGAMIFRLAFRQVAIVWRDCLNASLAIWILIGTARLLPDVRANGALALRDFAAVYYALFFFFAQAYAGHGASSRLLRFTLIAACVALPFTYTIYSNFNEWFSGTLVFRGVPFFYYKDDLVAAYLGATLFLLMTLTRGPAFLRYGVAALAFGLVFTIGSSRAALVAIVVTSGWWALARQWHPLRLQAVILTGAIAILTIVAQAQRQDFERSRIYYLYEHIRSLVDVTGTANYRSADREHVGDNNRFRASWWRAVAEETIEFGPALGLGFGANLTERFVRTYQLDLGEEFNVRSPHSIFFTVFGRMGFVGLTAWLAVVIAMVIRTRRLVLLARTDASVLPVLGWWSVAWILLVSGSFGVVLEGPMGAMPFWTALGLANASTHRACEHATIEASDGAPAPEATNTGPHPA